MPLCRYAAIPELPVNPIRCLYQENVLGGCPEEVAQVPAEVVASQRVGGPLAALGPDQEERRAGPVFPPHHQVRAELLEIEAPRVGGHDWIAVGLIPVG